MILVFIIYFTKVKKTMQGRFTAAYQPGTKQQRYFQDGDVAPLHSIMDLLHDVVELLHLVGRKRVVVHNNVVKRARERIVDLAVLGL